MSSVGTFSQSLSKWPGKALLAAAQSSETSGCQILNSIFIGEVSKPAPIEYVVVLFTIKSDP